ncbi:MAG TPA: PIN domain-containing protein [Candidatus Methylomirabilis sp.]|nr:PIN domain-containing protein [Candidatus Methylomirabilis sp.]HSC70158.1 PIN domain-containing protein [Candidatus Methylomirabilis sp.]
MAGLLLDSGALYALADRDDKWHARTVAALEGHPGDRVVPVTVLTEACYLLNTHLGVAAERRLVRAILEGELLLEGVILSDLGRADQILQKYSDANIGLVDATVVAIAERLGIRTVATTDRRHFSLFRPKHCRAFELLP